MENYIINEKYKIIRQIGKGTFGQVCLAQDIHNDNKVALKFISNCINNKDNIKSIFNEFNIQKLFTNCEYIVKVHDCLKHNNENIVVMEYCNLGNLFDYLKISKLDLNQLFEIFKSIVMGIKEIHEKNIIHRDIKSMNIFVSEINSKIKVKIGDFGSAKQMGYKVFANTIIGTPYYLSPEICEGKSYTKKLIFGV